MVYILNKKKIVSWGISFALLFTGGLVSFATNVNEADSNQIIGETSIDLVEEDENPEFISFRGEITELSETDESLMILVEDKNGDFFNAIYSYVGEDTPLISEKDMEIVNKENIEVGMNVSIFYHRMTPMTMSLPPHVWPYAVIIHEESEYTALVDYFDSNLLSSDGSLILNISEETIIVDKDGESLEELDIYERDLVVFTNIVLLSYPGQTSPHKIIVMPEREDNEIKENYITLREELISKEGLTLIPLRMVAESLGFDVLWNGENRTVETLKDNNWSSLTIGENAYSFGRMFLKLEKEPVIINNKTYVPLSFAEEVLQADIEIGMDNSITISK